jgi:hypothetical protein
MGDGMCAGVDWAATQRIQHAMVREPLPQSQGRLLDRARYQPPSMRSDAAKWHHVVRSMAALGWLRRAMAIAYSCGVTTLRPLAIAPMPG